MCADGTALTTTEWVYEPESFRPFAQINTDHTQGTSALSYIITDHAGTPRELCNEEGNIIWRGQHEVWGGYQAQSLQGLHKRYLEEAANDPIECDLRYQGQIYDKETGLYYNRHRYYDTDSGQYLSPDPIGMAGGLRPHGYVHNPMDWVDPLGLYSLLKDTGMGHHLIPRSVAKKLSLVDFSQKEAIAWYPNNIKGSDELHKLLHRGLIDEGVPYHGSKFEGSIEDFFKRAKKLYSGITEKGFLKVPYTDEILADDVTPKEAIEILEKHILGVPKHE